MSQTPQLPPPPQWLDHTQIGAALMSVPARISEVGRQLAEAQFLYTAAKEHREKEEAFLYQAARLQLEEIGPLKAGKFDKDGNPEIIKPKPPTEAQVQAFMRTDEVLAPRRDAAVMQEAVAEARYEALRADYRAVCTEADMVAESARNTRQELQNLDPTVRLAQLGRSWPAPADTRAPSQRTITTGLGGNAEDEGPV